LTDVFLSYARHDAKRAQGLVQVLEARGWSVFWDQRIPPGKTFARHIQQHIDEASCVVVLWTEHAIGSEWVQIEAAWAKRTHKLIPVLLDRVAERIPIEFSQIEASDLTAWRGDRGDPELLLLFDAIADHAGPGDAAKRRPAPAVGAEAKPAVAFFRSWKVWIGAVLTVPALAVGLWLSTQYGPHLLAPAPSESPTVPETPDVAPPQPEARVAEPAPRVAEPSAVSELPSDVASPEPEAPGLFPPPLASGKARLFVHTDPETARITMIEEGSSVVARYESGMPLEPGDYAFEVAAPGFEQVSFNISFDEGDDVLAGVSLDQNASSLNSTTTRALLLDYDEFPGVQESDAAFTADGGTLAAFAFDHWVELWDVVEHTLLHDLPVGSVSSMAFNPGATMLGLATRESPLIQLWATDSGQPVHTVTSGHESTIKHLVFSPDGRLLASSGDFPDRAIEIWDIPSIALRQRLACDSGEDHRMAFSADGKRLAVTCHDRIRVYGIESGDLIRIFAKEECCAFTSIAYSADGQWIAGGSGDGRVESWNVLSGEDGLVYGDYISGGIAGPYALAFMPDSRTVLAGYHFGKVDLWDVATGAWRGLLLGHDEAVGSIAIGADGTTVVTSSKDGSARVWTLAVGATAE